MHCSFCWVDTDTLEPGVKAYISAAYHKRLHFCCRECKADYIVQTEADVDDKEIPLKFYQVVSDGMMMIDPTLKDDFWQSRRTYDLDI